MEKLFRVFNPFRIYSTSRTQEKCKISSIRREEIKFIKVIFIFNFNFTNWNNYANVQEIESKLIRIKLFNTGK